MMISTQDLRALQSKGFFNGRIQDAQATFNPVNVGMPAGILSAVSPEVIENILSKRTGEQALGKQEKVLDWAEQKYYTPIVERTGQTTPYSDFGMPLLAGMNVDFNEVGHYRFSAKFHYGDLEAQQIDKARVGYNSRLLSAVTEALAVELNRTAFNGYLDNTSGQFLCYGLLNNPALSPYKAAAKTFETSTWQEVMKFFATAIKDLTNQSGNNINGQSKIRVVVSSDVFAILQGTYTDLGISVYERLKQTYEQMEFIPAIELNNAYNQQNTIYFIGESLAGGIETSTKLGYSEIAYFGKVVNTDYGFEQAVSAGTCGALIFKPSFIVRYVGV